MCNDRIDSMKRDFRTVNRVAILLVVAVALVPAAVAQNAKQKTFSSASEASKTLVSAIRADDESTLLSILGPAGKDVISSGDPTQDKTNRQEFVQKYDQMHRLVNEPDGSTTLYIGAENWPTPIPLKQKAGEWYFDTAAGKAEILYRRIGRNELSAIQVCRELVDAEKEYYGQAHDGDAANQYARKFTSDAGKHNGLYWQASEKAEESPIGPMLASAAAEGDSADQKPEPFMGYHFRILTEEKGPGGVHSFVVDGKMTRGFAFVAYPAEYRVSGVMTFLVNQDGIVYEKDLGPRTMDIAGKLKDYGRDASWRKAD